MKVFSYSDHLSMEPQATLPPPTALRTAVVHRVVSYDNSSVVRELASPGCESRLAEEIARGIPDGFPIVVDDADGHPIRSVLLHLLDRHRRPKKGMKGPRSLNSALASAYDLCHFLDHLDALAITFEDVIDQDVVDGFAKAQSLAPSVWTGRGLTMSTIERRVASVAGFCASRHFKDIGRADFSARSVPAYGVERDSGIHPLTVEDWKLLKAEFGPKPSSASPVDGPCVMRLIVEWSLWTAGRRTEITTLPLVRITAHDDLADQPEVNVAQRIRVFNTKGRRPRNLLVPAALLRETLLYVDGERTRALEAGGVKGHGYLFVRPASRRRPGHPLTPETVSDRFSGAVRRCALRRRSRETGGFGRSERPYVLHDLRHTAAVWLYIAFSTAGFPEPWKLVQGRLGHLSLETTTRKYLSFVDEYEIEVADLLSAEYDRWVEA